MAIDPYIGEIQPWPIHFAPRGWAFCEGQLLPISQYTALFALLGTQYGGNGRTNFALPDMRGRFSMGVGPGSSTVQGDTGGASTVTPASVPVASGSGAQAVQAGAYDNRPPFVGMYYIIALQGIFPPRS